MNITERVARAICEADSTAPDPDAPIYIAMKPAKGWEGRADMATAAIDAFLNAAAEKGWHMRPDQVTREMMSVGIQRSPAPQQVYEDMHNAAPKFEVGDG